MFDEHAKKFNEEFGKLSEAQRSAFRAQSFANLAELFFGVVPPGRERRKFSWGEISASIIGVCGAAHGTAEFKQEENVPTTEGIEAVECEKATKDEK